MTTHEQAIAAYQKLKAAGGVVVAPAPAAAPPEDPLAAQRASERAAIALLTPAGREAAAAERAAIAAATPQPPAPEPREVLRQAHRQRAEAQQDADRLHQALDRARAHQVEAVATRDAAQQALDLVEATDTARLIEELANGAGRVEAGGGAERLALAECEHQLGIANRAVDKINDEFEAAEKQLAIARATVEAAICQMLLAEAERQAVEILREVEAVDQRRARLDALTMQVTALQRRQGAARSGWPTAVYTALQLERLRAAPRLPSQFSTPAGDAMVQQWSRVAAALDLDPEAEI